MILAFGFSCPLISPMRVEGYFRHHVTLYLSSKQAERHHVMLGLFVGGALDLVLKYLSPLPPGGSAPPLSERAPVVLGVTTGCCK